MAPKKQEQWIQTAIRLPKELLDRAEKIADTMRQPGVRFKRADAIRVAATRGMEMLENEHAGKKK